MLQAKRQRYWARKSSWAGRKVRKATTKAVVQTASAQFPIILQSYNFWTLCQCASLQKTSFISSVAKPSTSSSLRCYTTPTILGRQSIKHLPQQLFLLRDEQAWWVVVGVVNFARCACGWHGGYQLLVHERRRRYRTLQGPVRHTGLQVRPCTARERSRVQALWGLPGVRPGCFILHGDDLSAGLQSDRRLVWQKLQRLGAVDTTTRARPLTQQQAPRLLRLWACLTTSK